MIKKITSLKLAQLLLISGLALVSGNAVAKQVPQTDAKTVAENFFSKYASSASGHLSYTSLDEQGHPLFYVFNMNGNNGFVIISAEDAASPVIGYSTEQGFQKPDSRSAASFWLSKRESELKYIRNNNVATNAAIAAKWNKYLFADQAAYRTAATTSGSLAPLVQTKWNQSPFYNDSCPGNSVTGCVATTMAQIMRYWSYPNKGTGASSYCDCTSSGFPNNFGTLSADYGAATYNWSNMPYTISTHNSEIAKLMYHCGVSVNMNYDPAGSSAAVISQDSPISAQNSYVSYFNYEPSTINGVYRSGYSDEDWIALLKGDLDIGRPVQYAGFGSEGGHTWVCDGYDDNDLFHMNWGWGSMADGFFSIDGLNPTGIDFNNWQQGLFGIVPKITNGLDAGVSSISPIAGPCSGAAYAPSVKIRNFGYDDLNSCTLNYQLDGGPVQSISWTGDLVTGQGADLVLSGLTVGSGAHQLTCYISNPNNGTDVNAANDQSVYSFAIIDNGTLPLIEGFEVPAQSNTHWNAEASLSGSDWIYTAQGFASGAQSMMVDNLSNNPGNVSVLMGLNTYNLAALSTPYIHFKVAYQQKASSNDDKLSLEVSTDCGANWHSIWSKHGAALASLGSLSSSPFMPGQSDFVEYAIPTPLNHNNIFRWVFTADATAPGNNIYLDDINIGDGKTVGIQQISAVENSFVVFPNPASGETFLQFSLDNASAVEVTVADVSGRVVMSVPKTNYAAGAQQVSINQQNSLSSGIYMVTVSANGVKSSRKLIIN